jgi:hypothetical protein
VVPAGADASALEATARHDQIGPFVAGVPAERTQTAAIAATRSLSFTRSSVAPRNHDSPAAWAASAASTGTSSMTSGSSAGSTRVPTRPSQASTNRSPTGSPTSSRSMRCRVCTPIRDITSRNRVRVGFSPTSVIVSSEPPSAAAATRKAAEDGSPGTVPEKPSCWNARSETRPGAASTGAPSAASARSV